MKVIVAGNQWVVRAGIKLLVGRIVEHVMFFEIGSVSDVQALMGQHTDIGLVLIDAITQDLDELSEIGQLRRQAPDIPVVVFSAGVDRRYVLRAIDSGAIGVVSKSADLDESLKALKIVLSGGIYVPPEVMGRLDDNGLQNQVSTVSSPSEMSRIQSLTLRQHEVFARLANGMSNADIARDLGKSEHTVRIHVSAILKNLGVKNRTQAALLAARYGYGHADVVDAVADNF
ncbi:response regulator transcription factor [bacterium]|nr:response regulator transcription factor [bacterium]